MEQSKETPGEKDSQRVMDKLVQREIQRLEKNKINYQRQMLKKKQELK